MRVLTIPIAILILHIFISCGQRIDKRLNMESVSKEEKNIDTFIIDSLIIPYSNRIQIYDYFQNKNLFLGFDAIGFKIVLFTNTGNIYNIFEPLKIGEEQKQFRGAGFDPKGNVMILKFDGIHFFDQEGKYLTKYDRGGNFMLYHSPHNKLRFVAPANKIVLPMLGGSRYPISQQKFYEEINLLSFYDTSNEAYGDLIGIDPSSIYATSENYFQMHDTYCIGKGAYENQLFHIISQDPIIYQYEISERASLTRKIKMPEIWHKVTNFAPKNSEERLDYFKYFLHDSRFSGIESTYDGLLCISQRVPQASLVAVEDIKREIPDLREAMSVMSTQEKNALHVYDLKKEEFSHSLLLDFKFRDIAMAINRDSLYFYQDEFFYEEEPNENIFYRISLIK